MPTGRTSGGFVIITPSNLITETRLQDQTKQNTFKVRNLDIFEVIP